MPQAQNSTAARKCQNIVVHSVGTFTYFLVICQANNPASSTGREILPKLNSEYGCLCFCSYGLWHQMPKQGTHLYVWPDQLLMSFSKII